MQEKNNVRFELNPKEWAVWSRVLEERKISGIQAFRGVLNWLGNLPPLQQNIVLGQTPPDPEVVKVIIRQIESLKLDSPLRIVDDPAARPQESAAQSARPSARKSDQREENRTGRR